MPRSDEQLPDFIKVNLKYKNANSGTWHAMGDQPGEVFISAKLLHEKLGLVVVVQNGKVLLAVKE